jgi:hypothetical protein
MVGEGVNEGVTPGGQVGWGVRVGKGVRVSVGVLVAVAVAVGMEVLVVVAVEVKDAVGVIVSACCIVQAEAPTIKNTTKANNNQRFMRRTVRRVAERRKTDQIFSAFKLLAIFRIS